MSPESADWWQRATRTFETAKRIVQDDPDTAASCAYYAAFYAICALFSSENRFFRKHSAVRDAVHRELIHRGRWPEPLGNAYDKLITARIIGDYGGSKHVSTDDAAKMIEHARSILERVREDIPEELPPLPR